MISLNLSFKSYEPNFLHLQIENLLNQDQKKKNSPVSFFLSHPFLFLQSVRAHMHSHVSVCVHAPACMCVCLCVCVGSEYIYVCIQYASGNF